MATAVPYTRSERFAEHISHESIGSDRKHKRGRVKTVSWPLNEKLCEVRHFFADDAPSVLGVPVCVLSSSKGVFMPSQTMHARRDAKCLAGNRPSEPKRARFTSVTKADGSVPPYFERRSPKPKAELTLMAVMAPWHHPHMCILDDSWLWAEGEESSEVSLQKQREMRMLEAFYPRLASIPDSPAEPSERCTVVLESQLTLIPLEEEEVQGDDAVEITGNDSTENCAQELKEGCNLKNYGDYSTMEGKCVDESMMLKQAKLSEADSNIAAVAAAACMVVKALGESDMVDEKLLLELLRNPLLLKSLTCSDQVTNNKTRLRNTGTAHPFCMEPMTSVAGGKLLPDEGAYLNGSPISVLSIWDEGTADPEPTIPNLRVLPRLKSEACSEANHGKFERRAKPALPETCSNSVLIPPNLHSYKPKVEGHLCRNGLRSSNPCVPDSVQSVCSLATSTAPVCLPSNTELPQKMRPRGDPLRLRLVRDLESPALHIKETGRGGMLNLGGGGRAKRYCMYFNSPRGCQNGGSCAFLHQSPELDAMAQ